MILTDNTKQILQDIKYFGGTISLKDNNLKLSFPDDFSNPDLLERIKINKSSLINFLVNESRIAPTLKQTDFRATSGQKGLWFLSQFEEGSNAYHITTIFDLIGEVNPIFLEKSFQILMDRHEILRTTFYVDEEGELYQQIHEKGRLNLAFNCFEEHDFSKQEELIKTYGNALFDLGKDSLFRSVLIKIDEKDYILSLTFHHIISDGWSVSVLIKELLHIYEQLSKGGNVVLPDLKIQYKDYAVWQRDRVSKMELSRSYWKDKLSGELPTLDLLGIRPPVKTYVGNRVLLSIDKLRIEKWKETCKENNATLFMGLLSGLNAILYRYTSQQDFIIGTATAGRVHQDVINQIGFYVNTLPLRTKVTSESSFLDLLSEVKETTLEAFEHQEYPFNEILEDIDIRRDASRSPLFDCMLVFQNNEKIGIESKGLKVIQRDNVSKTSKYDISFVFTENRDGDLNLELEYNTDLYQQDFIKQLGTHYINMINEMAVNEKQPIKSIEYLSKLEKKQLLINFNDTKVDYPKDKTIIDLFEEQVERTPNNIAVVFEDLELTYNELNEKANQLGGYLRENYQIVPDDLIGIKLDRSELMIIAILGILKSGAAYVPIDPTYPKERISYIENDSNTKFVIDKIEIENFYKNYQKWSIGNIQKNNTSINLVYVIYTSGTTGYPKGVMVENVSLINLLKTYNLKENNRSSLTCNYNFDVSVLEIFSNLICGSTLFIPKYEVVISPNEYANFIMNNEITHCYIHPMYLKKISEGLNERKYVLRRILIGVEPIKYDNIKYYINNGTEIINAYGPTETTICTSFFRVSNNNDIDKSIIPIGSPISNTHIYILDANLLPVPLGNIGRIYIGGASLARGYLNKLELTAEKFIPNPFNEGTRMYDSGDLGCWLSDGNIEFSGRKDKQVKIRGYRIELDEIEKTILKYSKDITEVYLKVSQKKHSEKILLAYIVSIGELEKHKLKRFLTYRLPNYMLPDFYIKLEALPLTVNGKIDIAALPLLSDNDVIKKAYVAPKTELEEKIIKIWSEVLDIKKIGVNDNFFELGGSSLNLIQLSNRINYVFNKKIEISKLYENSELNQQVALILSTDTISAKLDIDIPKIVNNTLIKPFPGQERLYDLSKGNNFYYIKKAIKCNFKLNIEDIQFAFSSLIKKNESLRSNFFKIDSELFLSFKSDCNLIVDYVDLRNTSKDKYEELHKILSHEPEVFDLEKDILIKVKVVHLDLEEFVIFMVIDHIIIDGWGIDIFLKQLYYLYINKGDETFLMNKEANESDYSYSRILEEKRLLRMENYYSDKAFWIDKYLEGWNDIKLPYDYPKEEMTFFASNININLDSHRSKKILRIALKNNVSLLMIYVYLVNMTLARFTNQNEITSGIVLADRDDLFSKDEVGFFLTTLPIRTKFNNKLNFHENFQIVKSEYLNAISHRNYTFTDLVRDTNRKFDLKNMPYYKVFVNESSAYDNEKRNSSANFHEISIKRDLEYSIYELMFIVSKETDEKINLSIIYNKSLFKSYTIKRLRDILLEMLDSYPL
ncbi:non-ribosomal peptide synthetase [Flavobacterium undicola]|uniref:non-ribosomal peptide synthetase n=1 Tax=Flavobacterium undicola TaxID=1932779 RepID=UPI001377147C|nr:non-ribosomal peptide synthetase [Flavobacterium undicola]MBA0882482.1 amino acid adenylation domain-containing protein [Flavobacterium undicola]